MVLVLSCVQRPNKRGKNCDLLQFFYLAHSPDSTVGIHDLHEIGVKRGHDDAVLPFSEDPVDQLVAGRYRCIRGMRVGQHTRAQGGGGAWSAIHA